MIPAHERVRGSDKSVRSLDGCIRSTNFTKGCVLLLASLASKQFASLDYDLPI